MQRSFLALLSLVLLLAAPTPSPAAAQDDAVRILFIPGNSPSRLRRTLTTLLAARGELVDYREYARAAGQANLSPVSRRALTRVATQQNATVIVIASYGGHYRRRILRVRFYDGQSAELITSGSHAMRGQHLRASAQHAIVRSLNQATGGRTGEDSTPIADAAPEPGDEGDDEEPTDPEAGGDDGGLPPPLDWDAEEAAATGGGEDAPPVEEEPETPEGELPLEEQRQVGFAVAAGAGIANRSATIPTMGGPATLGTTPFPAIQAEVLGYVRPDASSRFRLELGARYTTSVGLVAQEPRPDGTTRSTDMRAHHLRFGLAGMIPLAPGERPTVLLLEVGWQLRMLDSEIAVSIPDYTIGGLYARVGLFFTIGDSPISIGIVPEIGHATNLSEALGQVSGVSDGFFVGAEAIVRVQIIREVGLILMYREAHAFMGSAHDEDFTDAERYGVLRAEYRF